MQINLLFRSLNRTFATDMEEILKYFPWLSDKQRSQLAMLEPLYRDWNAKINVISRKDIDALYPHHVLHSLAIAMTIRFRPGTRILDVGTGGGFPGIPLAILFPECQFKLIDGTGKKITVVQDIAQQLGLENVKAVQLRAEEEKEQYHFVLSRGVMPLPDLAKMVRKNLLGQPKKKTADVVNALPNGIICLKGGNIEEEIRPYRKIVMVDEIGKWFADPWFKEKYVIYLPHC